MGFADAVAGDGFKLLAEVDPPKGTDPQTFLDTALSLRGRVDGIVVTDCAYAIMRMTSLAPSRLLIERNVAPVMSLAARDRNRLSFQGDLLAAWALGVRELLIQEGADPAVGDQRGAKSSGDLDLATALGCVSAVNAGKDLDGEPLEGRADFFYGVTLDVSDDESANREVAATLPELGELGVGCVVLSPTYDLSILDLFSAAAADAKLPLFTTVMLLKSVSMIRYLNSLPGVPNIPEAHLQTMRSASVKQQAGLDIAVHFLKDVEKRCKGAVLHGLGWGARLPELLSQVGR
ncbi:MAG: methylenetetrahydrofolate reductase [bacterium]